MVAGGAVGTAAGDTLGGPVAAFGGGSGESFYGVMRMKGSMVFGRAGVWLAAAMLPAIAVAQSNSATPPVTFSLPPSTRATPAPIPTSGPIIAPLVRPTPTPSILKIPTPTATATPAPRPTDRTYGADAISGVVNIVTKRQVTGVPTAPSPTPTPTASATPAPTPSATPVPAAVAPSTPEQPSNGISTGTIAIGGILLALVAAGAFLLGRRHRVLEVVAIDRIPEPAALPPEPATVPEPAPSTVAIPARRVVADEPQPKLEITLIPRRAGTNLMSAAVDYRVVVRNTGPVAARDVRFAMYMLTASARQAQDLQMVFTAGIEQPMVAPFELAPGQDIDLSGIAMLPRDNINVMTIEGRPWFVPVLAMKAEYRWGENVGAPGIATAAHMIGIDRGEGAKMAPFRLDGGPHMHPEVAERKVA